MHFTREPIIETIIAPKEGHKLLVRNSKIAGLEEHLVDSVEIVRFGEAYFYRSTEKPRFFLLPVSDYEIVEMRDVKVTLKAAGIERGIKIGGGKAEEEETSEEEPQSRRKDRGRRRRRRSRTEEPREEETPAADPYQTFMEIEGPAEHHDRLVDAPSEPVLPPSHSFNILLPPPPSLISEHFPAQKPPAENPPPPSEDLGLIIDEDG